MHCGIETVAGWQGTEPTGEMLMAYTLCLCMHYFNPVLRVMSSPGLGRYSLC